MLRTSIRVLPLRARRAKRRRRPRHDVPGAHMETVTQKGRFGKYGGRYVPETLIPALDELEQQYDRCRQDHLFQEELAYYLRRYCGRPTPLYFAERLTERLGGARVYLKREDLLHTGAHKINNTMGQVLLARRMGKGRVIAETGAGQHGVATATAAAMFGVACVGGGSNAMGLFFPFKDDPDVKMVGVEAGGLGLATGRHAATLVAGTPGVLHGAFSYLLQDGAGQVSPTHSVSAGLDYPGVGPEHSYFKDTGRAQYVAVSDQDALQGFRLLAQTEGIIPALEPAHAIP